MKLVMTLLVRDTQDILRENILYHLNQGVDFFIATDHRSTDSSKDILKEFESQGLLHLIEEKGESYEQATWVTRMARLAKSKYKADWVINNDDDEFWWPIDNTLNVTLQNLPPEDAVVSAPRHNFVPRLDMSSSPFEQMTVRHVLSKNSLGDPLPSKVCHRGLANVEVLAGSHSVKGRTTLKMFLGQPIAIFHFPIRSYQQLENKVIEAGTGIRDLDPHLYPTWRKLYSAWKIGALPDYFRAECLSEEQISAGIADGSLVVDERLRDFMRGRNII